MRPRIEDAIGRRIEDQMQREGYRTEWLQESYLKGKSEGRAEGKAEGLRSSIRAVFAYRGFSLTQEFEHRIDAEGDVERLERWLKALFSAESPAAAFADS